MEKKVVVIDNSVFNEFNYVGNNPEEISQNLLLEFFKDKENTFYIFFEPNEMINFPFFHSFTKNDIYYCELENIMKRNNNTMLVIYGGHDEKYYENLNRTFPSNFTFFYWPTFLIHYTKYYIELNTKTKIEDIIVNRNYSKHFFYLNNKPRTHRQLLLDQLYKNNLLDNNIFSWNILTTDFNEKNEFKYWKEKIVKYDLKETIDLIFGSELLENKALINLTCETNTNNVFITEKTYKSLLIGLPFLLVGAKTQNKKLESMGFVLYDEIFDYSFDYEENLEKRIMGVVDNIREISKIPPMVLFNKIKDKVMFNRQRSFEICNVDPFIPKELIFLYKTNQNEFIEKLEQQRPYLQNIFHNY